jgi:hypothetical protein
MTAKQTSNTSEDDRLDPVAQAILAALQADATPRGVKPVDIAKLIAAEKAGKKPPGELWRRYLPAVGQQAKFLARAGRIEILHKGRPIDPKEVKGVVRYRLAGRADAAGHAPGHAKG